MSEQARFAGSGTVNCPVDIWYPTADDMQLALEQFKTHFLKARLSAVDAIVAAVAMTRATPCIQHKTLLNISHNSCRAISQEGVAVLQTA